MKRVLAAIGLASVLAFSAIAGEIPTVGVNAPTPPDPSETSSTSPGDIPTDGWADELSNTDLSLVQMMISLVL